MFTGIVKFIGKVTELSKSADKDLLINIKIQNTPQGFFQSLDIGCSISCNGICLTLLEKKSTSDIEVKFEASQETISKTNLKNWQVGDMVNIEPSLKIGDELGGHLVSGHVDDVTKIQSISQKDSSYIFLLSIPQSLKKFISSKGSIVLNGVSLTINKVNENSFEVNLINHSFKNTTFQDAKIGDKVNLEIDMIARYLNNLISHDK
jgi:riboflavin synthase